jgi:hypothetical protein
MDEGRGGFSVGGAESCLAKTDLGGGGGGLVVVVVVVVVVEAERNWRRW